MTSLLILLPSLLTRLTSFVHVDLFAMLKLNAIILLLIRNFCFLPSTVWGYTMKTRTDLSLLYICAGVPPLMFYCYSLNDKMGQYYFAVPSLMPRF